jgi:hypothetical protein
LDIGIGIHQKLYNEAHTFDPLSLINNHDFGITD